jgi:FtsP/CotA-like multicopper oxidase with cupredoxin domain
MIEAARGSSHRILLRNETAFVHPMHLHGHHFRVMRRNAQPVPYTPWQDTVLVLPREHVEIAFRADNPGSWLFHCHILEHHPAGMSGFVRVT